jgi:poly(beta-D-mannuronate) lyase
MSARLGLIAAGALGAVAMAALPTPARACFDVAEPVITLDHGSRYSDDSATRSDFDAASNAEVNKALKPVDQFIGELVKHANTALRNPQSAAEHAACVADALAIWAEAGALGDLATPNAQMSAPSRIAGLAFAYASVRPWLTDNAQRDLIDQWLRDHADQIVAYWDRQSPPKASRNNLRAWAGVAVARIGLTLDADDLTHWAAYSTTRVACTATPDGSLPLEMARGPLALHYQLHALGPLVVSAALLEDEGFALFRACDDAIPRAVAFAVAALADPSLAAAHAGAAQSYATGDETLRSFEVAWAVAYLEHYDDQDLRDLVDGFERLSHSKLGGDQSLFWSPNG